MHDFPQHPPAGPAYGPPGIPPRDPRIRPAVLGGLIASYVSILMLYNVLAAPAAVTSVLAIRNATADPDRSRLFVMWTWSILAVATVLYIGVIVLVVLWATRR
ncbi:hypothetical protein [Actinomadura macrotermitis]|uniref:Uncharacterized protein n=1 Tax=Actinomadura macrotermitis TaxID=2585200 RepID=A0A7K0C8R4_9ACTN|nr:hypothetical protein [Actinomadura macrotermitis]MQY09845.1 hypothetical protein [Actinomadura macrotermitis]